MLQEYNSPERHDWPAQATREVSWNELVEEVWKNNDQPIPSAEAFSGGLGFRKVNWDASYWMAATNTWDGKGEMPEKCLEHPDYFPPKKEQEDDEDQDSL